jgi:predicted peptidase
MMSILAKGQNLGLFEKQIYVAPTGDTLPYRILYPKNFDSSKTYPLVLFLHGAGERGKDNESQLTHGAKLFLDEVNREKYPAIVIFPQCRKESYWGSVTVDRTKNPLSLSFNYTNPPTPPLVSAIALVNELIKKGNVEKSRVYIMGLSMGGMGTFEAVYRNPKLFAAAVPICGGGDVNLYDKRVKKVPFWIFHGAIDGVVNVVESRKMVAKLKALKADVSYTEYPDVNHNSWDNAFAEKDLLPWMFTHKR